MSHLVCIGLSHKTASVDLRERAALSASQQKELLRRVAAGQVAGINELVIVSTCNRTEFYADGESDQAEAAIFELWHEFSALTESALKAVSYTLSGANCVQHICRVAAGLDSQVIGEPQILGQVIDAYEQARAVSVTGPTLSALTQHAIQAGKRVRTETELGYGALSIGSVAATHASRILGTEDPVTVLIVGAGEMARAVAAAFIRHGIDRLLIANHTLQHAQEIADEWGGEVIPFTRLSEALHQADLVITAAAAPHVLLHADDLKTLLPQRTERPLVIFDVALPRNVEPGVGALAGVHLYNLDALQAVSDSHHSVREAAIPRAEVIAAEEAAAFLRWQLSRAVVPAIQHLRAKANSIRQSELEWLVNRWPGLTEHERALLEEFSQRLVNKLLHEPTLTLKSKSVAGEGERYADLIGELFKLTAVNF
ncbi:MAG: glutamyl-tRNA reductase [Aggregatilineales bacterium]